MAIYGSGDDEEIVDELASKSMSYIKENSMLSQTIL
mgnify:CR=1 FL=1